MYSAQMLKNKIVEMTKKNNTSATKVLEECGFNRNTLNQISEERGLSSFNLAKIADKLDCSVDYLLCRTQNPEAHKTHASDFVLNSDDRQLADIIEIYQQLDSVGKAKLLISADEIKKSSIGNR